MAKTKTPVKTRAKRNQPSLTVLRRDEILNEMESLQAELKDLDYEVQVESGNTKKKKVIIKFGAAITVDAEIPATIECAEYDGKWTPAYGKGDIEEAIWKFLDVGTVTINRRQVEVEDIDQYDYGFTVRLADTGESIYEY